VHGREGKESHAAEGLCTLQANALEILGTSHIISRTEHGLLIIRALVPDGIGASTARTFHAAEV